MEKDQSLFEEALSLFRSRDKFDFSFMWCCTDDVTLLDLSRAAAALQQRDLASSLLAEAIDVGVSEEWLGVETIPVQY